MNAPTSGRASDLFGSVRLPRPSRLGKFVELFAQLTDRLHVLDVALRSRPGRYIMAYHRVLNAEEARSEWAHHAIWISPELLEEHLKLFASLGRIVNLDELLTAETTKENLFAVTFDDAWADNLTNALPILDRHKIKACFFVATDAVSTGKLFWTENLAITVGRAMTGAGLRTLANAVCAPGTYAASITSDDALDLLMACIERLKEIPENSRRQEIDSMLTLLNAEMATDATDRIMTWDQIRQLAAAGHTIGSHTKTHLILQNISADRVDDELLSSKKIIEEQIGSGVKYFCYPNARFDAVSVARVLPAGYSFGFRMHNLPVSATSHRALIPRFSGSESNATIAKLKLRFLMSHIHSV